MSALRPRDGILRIKPHMLPAEGGDAAPPVTAFLASNESALGPSPAAREAARAAIGHVERYPEDAPEQLAAALGAFFDLDPRRIAIGFGSDDILQRLARAYLDPGAELIHSVHGYLKIPNYAHACDGVTVAAPDVDFCASVDGILSVVTARTRAVFLANPDNPTGTYLSGAEIRRLHAGLPGNVLLVLDSAYAEYVDAPDFEPAHRLVDEADNVVMTRTFSKIFGLAGMRLGWLYGKPGVVDVVKRIGLTFPVSAPALAAGLAVLGDPAHVERVRAHNARWRRDLAAALTGLGLRVYPSQGNFLLVRFDDPARSATAAFRFLERRGIVARMFNSADYKDCVRFTLGLDAEMQALIDALTAFTRQNA